MSGIEGADGVQNAICAPEVSNSGGGAVMTDVLPPLTDDIPPRRTRAALRFRAFIYHPAVMFGQVVFLVGVVAGVIVVVVTRGWL